MSPTQVSWRIVTAIITIVTFQAAIMAIPCVDNEVWNSVILAILKQKTATKSVHLRQAAKVFY